MGKKRIKLIGAETEPHSAEASRGGDKKKSVFKDKKVKKAGKGEGRLADMAAKALEEAELIAEKTKAVEKPTDKKTEFSEVLEKTESIKKLKRPKKVRSKKYKFLRTKVDRNKPYSLSEAVKLLLSIAKSKTDETVEVHIGTQVEKLTGTVKLPHGTGKTTKIAIADDELLEQVEKGKIDFDVLLASPVMMPKIAHLAKILGPRGLMPSPKTGTITNNPEELKKKMETNQEMRFKTEQKAPLIHLIIGKISFGEDKILANLMAVLEAVKQKNIKKATLASTQSPGIKLEIKAL